MTERSKARVCGRSRAGIASSNPAGGKDVLCCVCCTVQGKMQDNEDTETSTDEVQSENQRIKKSHRGHV